MWSENRRMPALFLTACLLTLVQAGTPAFAEGYPGFGLNRSRVVVMENDPSNAAVAALNNSTQVYLVQSRVTPADGATGWPLTRAKAGTPEAKVPFLVTPPLQRVEANGRLPLRILPVPGSSLPEDRESLFFLSTKAIPSQPVPSGGKEGGAQISLALQQYVKLFYRPKGLEPRAIFDGTVAQQLSVSRDGQQIRFRNPTPYYITFIVLTVGGKAVDGKALRAMVPPKGEQVYPLPAGVTGGQVEWQIVDEFGLATKMQSRVLG